MGSAYRECKSAFGAERCDSRLYSVRLQGKLSSSLKSRRQPLPKGPQLSLRLLAARARRRFGMTRWRALEALACGLKSIFPERCTRVTPKVTPRLKQHRGARRSATHADHRPIVAITRLTGLGRLTRSPRRGERRFFAHTGGPSVRSSSSYYISRLCPSSRVSSGGSSLKRPLADHRVHGFLYRAQLHQLAEAHVV
jgi:hypothetical protein